jgi:hypothetical protein
MRASFVAALALAGRVAKNAFGVLGDGKRLAGA